MLGVLFLLMPLASCLMPEFKIQALLLNEITAEKGSRV